MYERASGDKTLPSDLRPPLVLKRTLDYLFHDLLPRGYSSATFKFIRDRSRSVRTDFMIQHDTSSLAIQCHERCARFHILGLHLERDREDFSVASEEQQLKATLQSLKEFYNAQRATYQSPAELEMRVYHRLIHIREVERSGVDRTPSSHHVAEHPVYELTAAFRAHVQQKSQPITKKSRLRYDAEGIHIFGELVEKMMSDGGGGKGTVFLVACILESVFGKGSVEELDDITGGASWSDIIDGSTGTGEPWKKPQLKAMTLDADMTILDQEDSETSALMDSLYSDYYLNLQSTVHGH
ncbi:SAC3/GANP/Nin1/mts3/eIF-3 p25 family-domain-containing protein [Mycena galericulata]|nr:SAC3/GANP/Nin1/mts3/eIF-3 p25 family-domain-containing protein [Mycena galericulata]